MRMRGLIAGLLMLAVGAMLTWALGSALEWRAEQANSAGVSDVSTTTSDKTHWMF